MAGKLYFPDRNLISCLPACFQTVYFFQVFPALYPAPCIYMQSAWEHGCCQRIPVPADAWNIIRFQEWIIDSNGKFCNPAAKRGYAEYRGLLIYPSKNTEFSSLSGVSKNTWAWADRDRHKWDPSLSW